MVCCFRIGQIISIKLARIYATKKMELFEKYFCEGQQFAFELYKIVFIALLLCILVLSLQKGYGFLLKVSYPKLKLIENRIGPEVRFFDRMDVLVVGAIKRENGAEL